MNSILMMARGLLCLLMSMVQIESAGSSARLQTMLRHVKTKWSGVLVGAGVTGLVQSSSAITLLLVGWSANIPLYVSESLTVGANIGTCVTALLVAAGLHLALDMWLPLIGFAGLFLLKRRPFIAKILMGVSLLLIAMGMMSDAMAPIAGGLPKEQIYTLMRHPLLSLLVGCLITALVQSSSVTVGLLQVISTLLPLTHAMVFPFVMGQNIGTCITALIAAAVGTKEGKKLGLFHLRYNIINTAIVLPPWLCLCRFLPSFANGTASPFSIALFHLIFNIIGAGYYLLLDKCKKEK